ncbi:S-layer homology domain-containing protein [Paenibacillus campi]|uniref:S-layer homology domain-containing protein n=1 Tax=Paenibacillus campi TaxID=3106031 RepID=UPI002AFDDE42|nr:S-layer homology domain-containing protein [Paenibacillus sp. SGZ-1014]
MRRCCNFILVVIVLLSTTLGMNVRHADAAKTMVADETFSYNKTSSTYGINTGLGASIPSGSKDYSFRLYAAFPNSARQTTLTFSLYTEQSVNDHYVGKTLYSYTFPAGWSGWIAIDNVPQSPNGQPYITYNISAQSATTYELRTLRLQTYFEDVTPPTVPQIMIDTGSNINYWSNKPIGITISDSNDDHGIARYSYRIDGGGEQSYTGAFQMPVGAHTVEAIAYDNNGLSSGWSSVRKTYYAPDPPTAPVINGLPSGWTNQDVPFTITAGTDNVAGMLSTEYMLFDGRTLFDWTSSTQGTISQEGENTITARSTNRARTTSTTEARVYVDKTAPVSTLTVPQGWARSLVIHAVGKDALSGMKSITLPSGDVIMGSQADYAVTANGTYTFVFTDIAGNTVIKSITVSNIDTTAPTAPTVTTSSAGWSANPVQVSIGGSTDDSGIARYMYNIDGGTWQTYTAPFDTPTGQHTVVAKAYDNTGLSSNQSDTVTTYYDPQLPTSPTIRDWDASKWYTSFTLRFIPGNVGVSGLKGTFYSLSGATTQTQRVSQGRNPQTLTTEGITTVSAVTISMAGTESQPVTGDIKIDATPPTGTLTVPQAWAKSVTIHAVGTDSLSGMQSITLPSGDVVSASQADDIVSANGTYNFTFTDIAGNTVIKSITVSNVDTTPPTKPVITTSSPEWSASPVQVTIEGSTDDSGIAKYMYRIDDGTEQLYTGSFTAPKGSHHIYAMAYDHTGLSSGWSSPVTTYYDPDPPTIPVISGLDESKWYKSFVLQFVSGNGLSGARGVYYTLSGAMTQPRRAYDEQHPQMLTEDGITQITVTTLSQAGIHSSAVTGMIHIDSTPPIATLSASTDWAKSVTIHATGTDIRSGMQSIVLPNGDTVTGSEADYSVAANGTYTFTFTDVCGNTLSQSVTIANIDTTPPTKPVITTSDSFWSNKPVRVKIDGSTDDSGIAGYVYSMDGGAWQNYTEPFAAPIGQHHIVAMAYDHTGISSNPSDAVTTYYDPDPPTTPVITNLDSSKWYNSFTLQLMPGKALSGIKGVYYTLAGTTEQPRRLFEQSQTITADGSTTITATTINNAGGESEAVTGTIQIDSTPPVGIVTVSQGWAISKSIHAIGSDTLSGMQSITLPSGDQVIGTQADYSVTQNGTYEFTFTDAVGNTQTKSITISNIDDQPPTITVSQNGSVWTDQDIPVTFMLKDIGAGLDHNQLYYQWTTSPSVPNTWQQANDSEQTTVLRQEGIWYLHVKATDRVNHETAFMSQLYRLQRQPVTPILSVTGTATDKMLLSWSLPTGTTNTDRLHYIIQNSTTGKSWTVDYPINQVLDTSLAGGNAYTYTIVAQNHVGSSTASAVVRGVTLPQAPTSVAIYTKDMDYSRALVNIVPVMSATAYRITATNWTTKQIDTDVTVTGNIYQEITGLKPYTMYDFSVSAMNASGEGAAYHTSFLSLSDQPNGFKSAQITNDTIDLTWNSVTRAVYNWSSVMDDTYYRLRRDNQIIFTGLIPAYTDSGLESGMAYNYDVQARNSTDWGSKSILNQVWTLPAAPRSLRQTQATTDSFTVQLDPPKGSTGFQAKVDGQLVANLGSVLHKYTFTGYKPGTTHMLELAAYNRSGIGMSNSVIVTTLPDQPTERSIRLTDVTDHSVTLNVYELPGATKYKITINGNDYEVAAGQTTLSGLQSGTPYEYTVAAGNAAGYGAVYTGHLLTLPAAPSGYNVIKRTPIDITFAWTAVKGADSYEVISHTGKLIAQVYTPEYNASELKPGSITTLHIRAVNNSGNGATSSFAFQALPGFEHEVDDHKLVYVDQVGLHQARLHWIAVPGADQYLIYDQYQQLIAQTTEHSTVIDKLSSATSYAGYTIVPTNDTGAGKPMPVPAWVTLPDSTFKISYDSTRNSVTLHLQHSLTAETLVVAEDGKELYRGSAISTFVQDGLSPGSAYTFKVWTENAAGQSSQAQLLEIHTHKNRIIKPEVPALQQLQPIVDEPIQSEQTVVPSSQEDNKTSFIDINHSFAKASILRLANMGIVKGISADRYAPTNGTTRAEFMALLTRLNLTSEQIKQADTTIDFTDVDINAWYMPELRAAMQYGIVNGFSSDRFAPEQMIDREQAVKMLANALHVWAEADYDFYVDIQAISLWAQKEVHGLTVTHIIEGYPDQTFRPHSILTRAESAAMIDRAIQKYRLAKAVN